MMNHLCVKFLRLLSRRFLKAYYQEDKRQFVPFLRDGRYICIDGRPMLTIYRPTLFEQTQFMQFVDGLQREAKQAGFENGLYLIMTNAGQERGVILSAGDWHVDAVSEFPPHGMAKRRKIKWDFINPYQNLRRFDMEDYIKRNLHMPEYSQKVFRGVFPTWDNTARKTTSGGAIFDKMTPQLYKKWLMDSIEWTREHMEEHEQFVFINAWNEWAEGAHLEPDKRYGYAFLAATREAVEQSRR